MVDDEKSTTIAVVTGVPEIRFEDSTCALIATVFQEDDANDEGVFVRVQSWSESDPPQHPIEAQLVGKRVRVTVEVLGEES